MTATVYDFFQSTAKLLTSYGECLYEFVDLLDQETNELKAFDLSLIQPQTLKRKQKKWIQYVPEAIAAERNIDRYIPIESERLLEFRLPKQFHKKWMQTMKDLATTENLLPKFGFPSFGPQQNKVPFDFSQHNTLREQFITRLTNEIGWNMRKYPHDGILEYYWFYRFLKFERFKIELRLSLLNTLNKGLKWIGDRIGIEGQVVIDGLPTLADVEQAEEDLQIGSRSAESILNQFRPFHQ